MKLSSQTINDAKAYVEDKVILLRKANGKYRAVQARRLETRIHRAFKRQANWIIDNLEKLPGLKKESGVKFISRKATEKEIDDFLDEMPEHETIAENISNTSGGAYKKGASESYKKFDMGSVGIDFELMNPEAIDYMAKRKDLHLSDYRGSIKRTTRKRIIKIMLDATETGASYQDTARKIKAQGEEGVFSRYRAEMIATNEIGQAYEAGNMEMVDIYQQETGALMQKEWITSGDDRVTEECQQNQEMGWIGFKEHFNSGDDTAPRSDHPRCRCSTGYRQVDSQGNEI